MFDTLSTYLLTGLAIVLTLVGAGAFWLLIKGE